MSCLLIYPYLCAVTCAAEGEGGGPGQGRAGQDTVSPSRAVLASIDSILCQISAEAEQATARLLTSPTTGSNPSQPPSDGRTSPPLPPASTTKQTVPVHSRASRVGGTLTASRKLAEEDRQLGKERAVWRSGRSAVSVGRGAESSSAQPTSSLPSLSGAARDEPEREARPADGKGRGRPEWGASDVGRTAEETAQFSAERPPPSPPKRAAGCEESAEGQCRPHRQARSVSQGTAVPQCGGEHSQPHAKQDTTPGPALVSPKRSLPPVKHKREGDTHTPATGLDRGAARKDVKTGRASVQSDTTLKTGLGLGTCANPCVTRRQASPAKTTQASTSQSATAARRIPRSNVGSTISASPPSSLPNLHQQRDSTKPTRKLSKSGRQQRAASLATDTRGSRENNRRQCGSARTGQLDRGQENGSTGPGGEMDTGQDADLPQAGISMDRGQNNGSIQSRMKVDSCRKNVSTHLDSPEKSGSYKAGVKVGHSHRTGQLKASVYGKSAQKTGFSTANVQNNSGQRTRPLGSVVRAHYVQKTWCAGASIKGDRGHLSAHTQRGRSTGSDRKASSAGTGTWYQSGSQGGARNSPPAAITVAKKPCSRIPCQVALGSTPEEQSSCDVRLTSARRMQAEKSVQKAGTRGKQREAATRSTGDLQRTLAFSTSPRARHVSPHSCGDVSDLLSAPHLTSVASFSRASSACSWDSNLNSSQQSCLSSQTSGHLHTRPPSEEVRVNSKNCSTRTEGGRRAVEHSSLSIRPGAPACTGHANPTSAKSLTEGDSSPRAPYSCLPQLKPRCGQQQQHQQQQQQHQQQQRKCGDSIVVRQRQQPPQRQRPDQALAELQFHHEAVRDRDEEQELFEKLERKVMREAEEGSASPPSSPTQAEVATAHKVMVDGNRRADSPGDPGCPDSDPKLRGPAIGLTGGSDGERGLPSVTTDKPTHPDSKGRLAGVITVLDSETGLASATADKPTPGDSMERQASVITDTPTHRDCERGFTSVTTHRDCERGLANVTTHGDCERGLTSVTTHRDCERGLTSVTTHRDCERGLTSVTTHRDCERGLTSVTTHRDCERGLTSVTTHRDCERGLTSVTTHRDCERGLTSVTTHRDCERGLTSVTTHRDCERGLASVTTHRDCERGLANGTIHRDCERGLTSVTTHRDCERGLANGTIHRDCERGLTSVTTHRDCERGLASVTTHRDCERGLTSVTTHRDCERGLANVTTHRDCERGITNGATHRDCEGGLATVSTDSSTHRDCERGITNGARHRDCEGGLATVTTDSSTHRDCERGLAVVTTDTPTHCASKRGQASVFGDNPIQHDGKNGLTGDTPTHRDGEKGLTSVTTDNPTDCDNKNGLAGVTTDIPAHCDSEGRLVRVTADNPPPHNDSQVKQLKHLPPEEGAVPVRGSNHPGACPLTTTLTTATGRRMSPSPYHRPATNTGLPGSKVVAASKVTAQAGRQTAGPGCAQSFLRPLQLPVAQTALVAKGGTDAQMDHTDIRPGDSGPHTITAGSGHTLAGHVVKPDFHRSKPRKKPEVAIDPVIELDPEKPGPTPASLTQGWRDEPMVPPTSCLTHDLKEEAATPPNDTLPQPDRSPSVQCYTGRPIITPAPPGARRPDLLHFLRGESSRMVPEGSASSRPSRVCTWSSCDAVFPWGRSAEGTNTAHGGQEEPRDD